MRLGELIQPGDGLVVEGDSAVEISGLSYDSRKVAPGNLFFAVASEAAANRIHVEEAISRGARAVLMRRGEMTARPAAILVECERPRLLMALIAARFFDFPSRKLDLVGVTGTSGKTTTTYLLAAIFRAAGDSSGLIGTVGSFIDERRVASGLTTPESVDLEATLAQMASSGVKRVAAEISSIGLSQERVEHLDFQVCLFTNLGRDHLDYHRTIEDYFAAKLRLFTELLPASHRAEPTTVAPTDDDYGRRVLEAVRTRRLTYGLGPPAEVRPLSFKLDLRGIEASVQARDARLEISSPLLGLFNLRNILGAVAVSGALGIEWSAVVEGVRRCSGAPGRIEAVARVNEATVLVDYAHKPEALAAVLDALRSFKPHRLICVFGCGGDRDRGKRPIMGEIAARKADFTIITSDNPRSEDPLAIIGEIEKGLAATGVPRREAHSGERGYAVQPDRRAAIASALSAAVPGDLIVIAGKGHEDYQLIGSRRLRFDDRAVVRELAAALERRSSA